MRTRSTSARSLTVMLLCLLCDIGWTGEIIALPSIGATVQAIPGWTATPETALASFSPVLTRGVAAHAKAKNILLQPGEAEAKILAMWSFRHSNGDNPNVILQIERIWAAAAGKTGKDFIDLMTDRCALFAKHNQRQGEIREWKSGGITFHCADFENRLFPKMITQQEYIATVVDNHYVVFVLSYNDKTDADYEAMRGFVGSFVVGKPAAAP